MQQTQIQYFNETFHTQFHLSLVKRVNRSKSSYKAKLSYFDYLIFLQIGKFQTIIKLQQFKNWQINI